MIQKTFHVAGCINQRMESGAVSDSNVNLSYITFVEGLIFNQLYHFAKRRLIPLQNDKIIQGSNLF